MLLSALPFLVVAQSSSEVPKGLMNNPVLFFARMLNLERQMEVTSSNAKRRKSETGAAMLEYEVTDKNNNGEITCGRILRTNHRGCGSSPF